MFFASCKNDDHVELEVIIDPSLFQKPPPKDAFSAMINASTTKRTILTSNFAVCKVEKFQTAYETAANKEYFLYFILFKGPINPVLLQLSHASLHLLPW